MNDSLSCWNCGASLASVPRPISRHANCEACAEMLHCCRMCAHYEPEQRPYCDNDLADPPSVKENANFCEYFAATNRFQPAKTSAGGALSQLENLFGDESVSDDSAAPDMPNATNKRDDGSDPASRLDSLFDD